VEDQEVRYQRPILVRDEPHEVLLDLHRIVVPGQRKPLADSGDMGIDRDPFVSPVGISQDDIGGLAPDAGQGAKLLHGVGHLSAVLCHDCLRHSDQALGLVAEEPGGLDDLFELRLSSLSQGSHIGISGEQDRGHQIHPRIGALRREDRRAEQLKGIAMVQRAGCVGIGLLESLKGYRRPLRRTRGGLSTFDGFPDSGLRRATRFPYRALRWETRARNSPSGRAFSTS